MNLFGQIADELTSMIEDIDHAQLAVDAKMLQRSLQAAFVQACTAEREVRHRTEGAVRGVSIVSAQLTAGRRR